MGAIVSKFERAIVPFTVRLPAAIHERLREQAYRERATFQDIVQSALLAYLSGGAAASESLTVQETAQLAAALDLLRQGPPDLRRVLVSVLRYWETVRGTRAR